MFVKMIHSEIFHHLAAPKYSGSGLGLVSLSKRHFTEFPEGQIALLTAKKNVTPSVNRQCQNQLHIKVYCKLNGFFKFDNLAYCGMFLTDYVRYGISHDGTMRPSADIAML